MVNLKQADKIAIVRWLSELPEFETETGRRRLLSLAGLSDIAPQIEVSGSPLLAASSVVEFLSRYGRPTPDAEALGLLLNLVSSLVGLERQQEISGVLRSYLMMTPMAVSPPMLAAAPGFTPDLLVEKIIGQNALRPIAFLRAALRVSRAVALVTVEARGNSWTGTGFLVGPNLFVTNQHVVGSVDEALGTTIDFDFEEDEQGRLRRTTRFRIAEFLIADPILDYSLLRVDGSPGGSYGWLPLQDTPIKVGDRVNIIQHPGGQPKQIAIQNNVVEYVGGGVVQYVTSTLPGSSGSPVFNDKWEVVALHHAGGMLKEPTTGASYYRNEGVLASAINAHLPSQFINAVS